MFPNNFHFIKMTRDQKYCIAHVCAAKYEAETQMQTSLDPVRQ